MDIQKKAVIVGGSNGLGLAISRSLIDRGYYLEICDKSAPEGDELDADMYQYHKTDLQDYDDTLFSQLALDSTVNMLVITAGVGRVADFQYYHQTEIAKTFKINTISLISIIRAFYNRIMAQTTFYTVVVGSISGWVSSPEMTVYSASKAAVVRFVESVNIELEMQNSNNRILDVSPASFSGSKFYGGKNDLSLTMPLAEQILMHAFLGETRFIPDYDKSLKSVIEWYNKDPHEYGIHSWKYKQESGRVCNKEIVKIGYLSGTFDLFHVGHLNLLKRAKQRCDYLIVGVHGSGAWKGKETFIPLDERKAIVGACKYVDRVVDSCREDSDAWYLWHYDMLFVGSDYQGTPRFQRYEEFFRNKGVEIVYFPYTKTTNSTQIRDAITKRTIKDKQQALNMETDNKDG